MAKEALALNVCLLTMARSRSSMTAEIFRQHGYWFGRTFTMAKPGMGYNENQALKRWARRHRLDPYVAILQKKDPQMPRGVLMAWESIRKDEGWTEGTPWAVKVDAFCNEAFATRAHLIGIYRNPEDILSSCLEAMPNRFTAEEWTKIIARHHAHMLGLGIPMIMTDELVQGDYTSVSKVFDKIGIELDAKTVHGIIDAKRSRLNSRAS